MFTRCPQCKTVHKLQSAQLSHAHGLVKCGQCGRSFSALNFLYDEWPAGEAYRPEKGARQGTPVLGGEQRIDTRKDNAGVEETVQKRRWMKRLAWSLATALLVLLTAVNAAWTFRDSLAENPAFGPWLERAGWLQQAQQGLSKSPQQLQLVSHDMHSHPTRAGILVLSMTIVNLATHPQVYPVLEVTLLDEVNQPVARRRLQPVDYLRAGADFDAGLAPEVYLPILLEFADPGMRAVGFEIRFL
ncbi:MAG: zinc-ribbon and DUF3426 domain-containing protein [Lysobacterales bacterium]|jgi:predicted Zn finger-like uncharacterized protein